MFNDRKHAGILLAASLKHYQNDEDVVVIAIPRGGIIAGYEIAKYLNAPLDILLVKKIGHPENKECAIGAISMDKRMITYDEGISKEYIKSETERIQQKLKDQYLMFFGDRTPTTLENKKVIIVDDGIATGNTLMMVIEVVKAANPKKVIVAVPVGPMDIISQLNSRTDEVICLETPHPFHAVGAHYRTFGQVENETVVQLLNDSSLK
jgi:putative phosphoribosyl transferase